VFIHIWSRPWSRGTNDRAAAARGTGPRKRLAAAASHDGPPSPSRAVRSAAVVVGVVRVLLRSSLASDFSILL